MHSDALMACAQNRMNAVEAVDSRAACPRLSLIAASGGVVEVITARPLHQIAADRRHVAKLWRGTRQNGLGKQRVATLNIVVIGNVCVRHECAKSEPAPSGG